MPSHLRNFSSQASLNSSGLHFACVSIRAFLQWEGILLISHCTSFVLRENLSNLDPNLALLISSVVPARPGTFYQMRLQAILLSLHQLTFLSPWLLHLL
jgi:hypothetical protein